MRNYRFGRAATSGPLHLPALVQADHLPSLDRADGTWLIEPSGDSIPAQPNPAHIWLDPHGTPALELSRVDELYQLTVPGSCRFIVSPAQRRIGIPAEPHLPDSTLEHLLIDQILPRCLAHDGALILHAAGVAIDGAAVLFMGESGQGKSTLSAALQRLGHPVLSDDCLELDTTADGVTRAWPTYPSLRLLPDMLGSLFPGAAEHAPMAGYSDKRRVPVEATAAMVDGMPLRAIHLLQPPRPGDEGLAIEPIAPAAALLAVNSNLFKLDPTDMARTAALLAKTAAVVRTTPVFSLRYPRGIDALPGHAAAIAAHAR